MMADGGMTLGRGHSTPIDNYKRGTVDGGGYGRVGGGIRSRIDFI